jgi:hypothetical protein
MPAAAALEKRPVEQVNGAYSPLAGFFKGPRVIGTRPYTALADAIVRNINFD